MEEVKDTGLQQEQPVEAQETKEPEFRLTEDGQIEGDFSDWGLSSDEGEQPVGEQKQEQQRYYTPEEIKQIGIDKLDPNRIPPELLPWYKSMQADYTRKTQAVAEERRVVEKLLDKALSHPELAKEFMNDPELVSLAQKHPELGQKLQAVSQMAQPEQKSPIDLITEQAKKLVEQQLGEEFDELDPRHIAAFNIAVQHIQSQIAQQQAVYARIEQVRQSEPNFAEIDRYALEKLQSLPFKQALEIQSSFDKLMQFWEECRKEWYNQSLNGQTQQAQQAQNPPPVEKAGKGEVEQKPALNPAEFGAMSEDEQAQMLIQLGLV